MGVMAVFALLVFVGIPTLIWVWEDSYRDQNFHGVETTIQVRVNKTAEGEWLLLIVYGDKPVSSLTLQAANQTGEIVLKKTLASIKMPSSDPDAVFNDTDGNNILNAGDTILLKASGGHVQAGCAVQILRGDLILGLIRSLP